MIALRARRGRSIAYICYHCTYVWGPSRCPVVDSAAALICIDAATRHSCVFALDGNPKNSTVVGEAFLKHSTRVEEDLGKMNKKRSFSLFQSVLGSRRRCNVAARADIAVARSSRVD